MDLCKKHNCCASCTLDYLKSHILSLKVDFLFQSFLVIAVCFVKPSSTCLGGVSKFVQQLENYAMNVETRNECTRTYTDIEGGGRFNDFSRKYITLLASRHENGLIPSFSFYCYK